MTLRERFRDRLQPIYFLGQNPLTLTGAVVTTSTALTTIAFWFYDIFLPGPPHPYIGLLVFLILPGIFVLGLLLIPLGIWAHLDTSEVQEMHGVRVTRPLRTIVDLLRSGHVDRSQLKLAVDEAIRRGLIGTREIDRLPDDKLQRSLRELASQPA